MKMNLLNHPIDLQNEYLKPGKRLYPLQKIKSFNPQKRQGVISSQVFKTEVFNDFDTERFSFKPQKRTGKLCPFDLSFISSRTIRLRIGQKALPRTIPSLMIPKALMTKGEWTSLKQESSIMYKSGGGSIAIHSNPWSLEWKDRKGNLLTKTYSYKKEFSINDTAAIPFSFSQDSTAASFILSPGEKIFGCGESFDSFNKRGSKVQLYTTNAFGGLTSKMYKPVPFFISDRGYGMFVHSSVPMTFDFGHTYGEIQTLFIDEPSIDLFFFMGTPKQILSEYTNLIGKSPVPPLWSFGLWMSSTDYNSEKRVRQVAAKLQENHIPADVIHLDAGCFSGLWDCDFKFSPKRFPNPSRLINDIKKTGFKISLWQFPYLTPNNPLLKEAKRQGYLIANSKGKRTGPNGIIDLSNAKAAAWYQNKLENLFKLGVDVMKVDFGESAPLHGRYASGRTGQHEHNLYGLRYNKLVADLTKKLKGYRLIWARSGWAGSQRYPVHWGGDAESRNSGMAATLRAGLSLGLCGFTFWSHDVGGFWPATPENVYRRWLPFGLLSSHSRVHGFPPTEPWKFGPEFIAEFKRAVRLRYKLLPYIYAQSMHSARLGHPMMRPLFFQYPNDPGSWIIDDEYFLGNDMLVAPLIEESNDRNVYLPPGIWIDYQTEKVYTGGKWHHITCGKIPVIMLVRNESIIPHIKPARKTRDLNWNKIEAYVFATQTKKAEGLFALPDSGRIYHLSAHKDEGVFELKSTSTKALKNRFSLSRIP